MSGMRGDAVRILHNLGNHITFQVIEQELQRRFGQEEQSKIYLLGVVGLATSSK